MQRVVSLCRWLLLLSIIYVSSAERLGFGAKCIMKSRKCAERRIAGHSKHLEIRDRPVFRDAFYHYCLDLFACQEGKQQICSHVGRTDGEYADPNLRRRLIDQCHVWKLPITFTTFSEPKGHYAFFAPATREELNQ